MHPEYVYQARVLFAGLVPVSLALGGTLFVLGDRVPGSDHVGYSLLSTGLCGVGLAVTSVGWLVMTEDPVALDYLGAALGVLFVTSLTYETYTILTEHTRVTVLADGNPLTLGVALLVLTALVLLQPSADATRVYTARVLLAVLIPVGLGAAYVSTLAGAVLGGGDDVGLAAYAAMAILVFGLCGLGLSAASIVWAVTAGKLLALDYLETLLSVAVVLSFAGTVRALLSGRSHLQSLVPFVGSLAGLVLLVLARHATRTLG